MSDKMWSSRKRGYCFSGVHRTCGRTRATSPSLWKGQ